ncbi:MAG TPA: hypothetical protein VFM98_09340, partial [Ramlibacter sp.]|uniref:hypothetical protein n=1 Tax=Ramlibacter sp. TaxID=1917967 RepID=UPI002D7ED388
MNDKDLLVCTLQEARERAGVAGEAPALARALRERGASAVVIVGARDGLDWLDTPEARGWLGGPAQSVAAFATAMRQALSQGYVAADAAIVAKTISPYELPPFSWDEAVPPSPFGGRPGWGH